MQKQNSRLIPPPIHCHVAHPTPLTNPGPTSINSTFPLSHRQHRLFPDISLLIYFYFIFPSSSPADREHRSIFFSKLKFLWFD
ncbi:hypothetical protein L1987_31800 [Smallanthus sonchifolius]|uniref:Uncharacterized protein n=1 Tax=Smallanthus sonchifolius TaxID=185202 RepID=A0ACB9I780_9ASTR|nr:hypothetical protein L1987_31800 [Smallanthus sonchifolius]